MLGVGKVSFELKALEQEGAAQACRTRLIGKDLQIILHQCKMFNQILNIPLAFHRLESSTSQTSSRRKRTGPLFRKELLAGMYVCSTELSVCTQMAIPARHLVLLRYEKN